MASSMGPAKMVTDGLVLHLDAGNNKSYHGSGTVWTDLSQTAITGSLTNGPTYVSTNNGLIRFDGTNDYVDLGNTNVGILTGSSAMTLETWFYPTNYSASGGGSPGILSLTTGSVPYGGWQIAIGTSVTTPWIEFAANISGTWRSCNAYRDWETDRKSTRLNSSHSAKSRMPSSA